MINTNYTPVFETRNERLHYAAKHTTTLLPSKTSSTAHNNNPTIVANSKIG